MRGTRPSACLAALAAFAAASTFAFAQGQRPVFRSTAEAILVDVQVVDRTGAPVTGLTAEDFRVRLNRDERRVLAAEFVDYAELARRAASLAGRQSSHPDDAAGSGIEVPTTPRTFILAIDESSFHSRHAMAAVRAARGFVEQLAPADRVGLYTYPVHGPTLELTTDHTRVLADLDRVVGVLELPITQLNITVSEVVDINAGDQDVLQRVARRECDPPCYRTVEREARALAFAFETQVGQSVAGLRTLLAALRAFPERKILVLISGGLLAGDRPGGRPDVHTMMDQIGEEAALANTSLFVIHMDTSFIDAFSPKGTAAVASLMRDSSMLGFGLERFSDRAGGALFRVSAGTGEYAFERVDRETSAYYLLAVEPTEEDRDGRPHYIDVEVDGRGIEVRSRTMVVIPGR